MERNNFSTSLKRKVFHLFTISNRKINMVLQMTFSVVISLARISLFYWDLLKDALILESLFHVENKVFQNETTESRYQSVGGLDFTLLAYYLIGVFVVSEAAIFLYMYRRRDQYQAIFDINEKYSAVPTFFINLFPMVFLPLQKCKIGMKLAHLEYKISKLLNGIENDQEYSDSIGESVLEIADEVEALAKQLHHLNHIECEVQILETCLEREPQLAISCVMLVLMKQFSRIRILFDSFFGIGIEVLIIGCIMTTMIAIIRSIKRYRDKDRFPNTSGLFGTVIQLLSISCLLVPKMVIITLALLNLIYIHALLYFVNVLLVIFVYRLFYHTNITIIEALVTATCPAYCKPAKFTDNETGEDVPQTLRRRIGPSMVTALNHLLTISIFIIMGCVFRRTTFQYTIKPEKDFSQPGLLDNQTLSQPQFFEDVALTNHMFTAHWLWILLSCLAAYLAHILLVLVYYSKGHPWSAGIHFKSNPSNLRKCR
jgi:hypothetical protein